MSRRLLTWMFVLLLGGGAPLLAASGLPPIPAEGNFVQDFADLLSPETESEIGRIQKEAFEAHRTPIVVVTIDSMSTYGRGGISIEPFAREWFDHWQIGARGPGGELVNQGILLIVSRQDREARIELGADWGRRWDSHAARIMDERIVPRFKRGDFDAGIQSGVTALGEMAALGPEAKSPGGIADMIPPAWREEPLSTSPLPGWGIWSMVIAGVICIAASFGFPAHRKLEDQLARLRDLAVEFLRRQRVADACVAIVNAAAALLADRLPAAHPSRTEQLANRVLVFHPRPESPSRR